jgi:hypothetical protein
MDFSQQSGNWQVKESAIVGDGTHPVQLAASNPYRWALLIQAITAAGCASTTQNKGGFGPTFGIQLVQNQILFMRYADYAGAVQQAWWGTANGAPITFTVIEIIENYALPEEDV